MRRLILLALLGALLSSGPADAQTPTEALCRPIQEEWGSVAGGSDLAAMDREIGKMPPLCAALKRQAEHRRAAVAARLHPLQVSSAAAKAARERALRDQAARDQAAAAGPTKAADAFQTGLNAYNSGDYAEAMAWWRKAAAQGDSDAQASVGVLYRNGLGVPKDYAQTMDWFRKSAAQENARAEDNIGILYRDGWGVPRDYAQAMDWFRKSAAHGYAPAEDNIGALYANGWGVPRDDAEARAWMTKAAAQGQPNAKRWLAQHQ